MSSVGGAVLEGAGWVQGLWGLLPSPRIEATASR